VPAAWLAAWGDSVVLRGAGVRVGAAVLVGLPLALFADAERLCGVIES
jgi:hypothetical protein